MSAWLRCALWTLVLIRLLIPWTVFSSPVSVKSAVVSTEIGGDLEAIRDVGAVEYGTTDKGVTNVYGWTPQRLAQSGGERSPEKAVSVMEEVTEERAERVQKTLEVRKVLTAVWMSGAGLAAAYFIFVNIRFFKRLRDGGVRLEPGIASRPVYSVEGLSSSCLFGRSVYVPKETADDPEALRCVLAHELAHYRHGDTLRAVIWDAVLALHWYNPLVWLAAFLARRDSEIYADADAIKALGEGERENYGMTLIRLSSKHVSGTNFCVAATSMTNGKRTLKERIKHMSNKSKMSFMIALAVILLAAAAVGCSFLGGKGTEADPKDAAVTPEPTVIPTEAVTAAPTSVPTESPTEAPSEEPTAEPGPSDEWFIDEAWALIGRLNELYNISFEKSECKLKTPRGSYIPQ
ncbi:MAG: M48 family metalloprotease, partial [Oscillospiraceae bacterium]|nr:M48 family metalloprotease [Oscillospiraceae bacterium]